MLRYRKILSRRSSAYRKDTVSHFGNRFWQLSETRGVCEPTKSAKHSPQPDALHHITTHINTIIYSVRCCFAIEHPRPGGWRRDGCASAPELFHERKGPVHGSVPSGSGRTTPVVRGIGGLKGNGCAQGLHGACPGRPVRGPAHGGAESRHRTLPAPRPASPGSCCPRVPFTAGARAFRLALPAPRPVFRRGLSTPGIPPGGRAGSSL